MVKILKSLFSKLKIASSSTINAFALLKPKIILSKFQLQYIKNYNTPVL